MRCDMPTRSSASCTRFLRSADPIPREVSGNSTFSYTVRSPMRLNAWKMKPISRLRIRARAESFNPLTGRLCNVQVPSLGVSSNPRIASRVDLPQPDGPAIERYSPFFRSSCIPDRAWVSTSSVTNTFVTSSKTISDSFPWCPFHLQYVSFAGLVQFYSLVGVPSRHIRQDHPVAHIQPAFHLDSIHRSAAERHLHAIGVLALRLHLEQANFAIRLPEHRPAHVDHSVEPHQLDGSIHAQIRTGARRI